MGNRHFPTFSGIGSHIQGLKFDCTCRKLIFKMDTIHKLLWNCKNKARNFKHNPLGLISYVNKLECSLTGLTPPLTKLACPKPATCNPVIAVV